MLIHGHAFAPSRPVLSAPTISTIDTTAGHENAAAKPQAASTILQAKPKQPKMHQPMLQQWQNPLFQTSTSLAVDHSCRDIDPRSEDVPGQQHQSFQQQKQLSWVQQTQACQLPKQLARLFVHPSCSSCDVHAAQECAASLRQDLTGLQRLLQLAEAAADVESVEGQSSLSSCHSHLVNGQMSSDDTAAPFPMLALDLRHCTLAVSDVGAASSSMAAATEFERLPTQLTVPSAQSVALPAAQPIALSIAQHQQVQVDRPAVHTDAPTTTAEEEIICRAEASPSSRSAVLTDISCWQQSKHQPTCRNPEMGGVLQELAFNQVPKAGQSSQQIFDARNRCGLVSNHDHAHVSGNGASSSSPRQRSDSLAMGSTYSMPGSTNKLCRQPRAVQNGGKFAKQGVPWVKADALERPREKVPSPWQRPGVARGKIKDQEGVQIQQMLSLLTERGSSI